MLRLALSLAALAALPTCGGDETLAAYGAGETEWQLIEIDAAPFPARATLRFLAGGAVTGTGPCNTFTATQSAPYPWFALERVAVTQRACPDLPHEAAMLDALGAMTLAETGPGTLLLSNDAGREMYFRASD